MSDPLMSTYTGKQVNPWELKPEDICVEDIAHSLSLNCRFNGHCKVHYSVAQHCLICSQFCPEFPFDALMHDSSEAYISDICRYVKRKMPEYQKLEEIVERAIADRFDLQYPMPAPVKLIDNRLVLAELRDLMIGEEHPTCDKLTHMEPLDYTVVPITFAPNVERMFLDRFRQLTNGISTG